MLVCATCRRRLAVALEEIRSGFYRLDPAPGQSGPDGGRGGAGPGFGSRPPLRIDVVSLTYSPVAARPLDTASLDGDAPAEGVQRADPDSPPHARAREGAEPVLVAVGRVADRGREDGWLPELTGPRTVGGEVRALLDHVADLAGAWWVGEALAALERCARTIRRALGEDEVTIPLGRCPQVRDVPLEGAGGLTIPAACSGEIRARAFGYAARCRSCGHRWQGADTLRALGRQLGDAYLDLAALQRYLEGFRVGPDGPSVDLLRKWASRHGWARRKVGRRTTYRLADARESAWAWWDRAHPVQGPELPPDWLGALEGPVPSLRPERAA